MTRWRSLAPIAIGLILLTPLASMRFTDSVQWTGRDFGVMAALLVGVYVMFELLARTSGIPQYRWGVAVALGASLLLVWVNLAIGIIGSEDNPANQLYLLVLLTGAVTAIATRFRPRGMARATAGMAVVQAVIGGIALAARLDTRPQVMIMNALFVGLFVGASLLFGRATEQEESA
ncbi:MAG TPA: hypothetical protein P5571_15695 [Candidatus Krumholzibacteria bacterium]|nr:hypothetical protein [Candidatus Krumholzibacteria bacterium]HRX52812.1 hypothetical protein [Candidatus Krumholzibacteria bacterium]